MLATRGGITTRRVLVDSRFDHNRDGAVNALDYAVALRNLGRSLSAPTPPVTLAAARPPARTPPPRRTLLGDATASVLA